MRSTKLDSGWKRSRKALIAGALSLATAIVLAACGGGDDDASLGGGGNVGEGGEIVSAPGAVTPEQAAATQDFWTPAKIEQAADNPVDLVVAEGAKPAEIEPAGKETTVEGSEPTEGVNVAGSDPGEPPAAAGGQGFQVESLAETQAPFPTNGKLMTTFKGGQTGSCSATMVEAANQSLVVTAGHCVFDHKAGLGWGSKFVFIPGYKNGNAPYGEWPAQFQSTFSQWEAQGNFAFDVAFLSLFKSPSGKSLQSIIGARGISFNYATSPSLKLGLIGYPAVAPYTGNLLLGCQSGFSGSADVSKGVGPPNLQAPCDFTPGSSGGGWLSGGTGGNSVVSVTSTRAPGSAPAIDGPYFGNEVLGLYKQEQGKTTKNGAPTGACLRLKKAQDALKRAKARAKAKPSPAAKRAVQKAKKAVKKALKSAKFC